MAPDMSPKIVREPSMIQIFTISEPLVLECLAESMFDGAIRYMWTKNGRPFRVDNLKTFSESSSNGNILFTSPGMGDVGTYQCEAMNQFGKVFSQASLLRAKQPRNQPRRLNIVDPVPAQVLVDPIIETKETIKRVPITEAVPEILPNFVEPIFLVYPKTSEDEEPALVMNMQTMEVTENQTEETPVTNIE